METTVALVVLPTQEIVAVEGLQKPSEPMHSGYTDEECEILSSYNREWGKYHKKLKAAAAIKCDQTIAKRILDEQYPDRKISPYVNMHYDVKGISMDELFKKADPIG